MPRKRIFISYRRSDSSGHAGRLFDYLKNYFGDDRLFFDVDTIQPGTNFEQKINDELDNSEAELVLIGNQWLESRDPEGNRKLDNPHDYVRYEVETALNKNITVIPILLHGTQMPSVNTLPATLQELSRRNAVRLNDDHWSSDCKFLAGILKNALDVSQSLKEGKIRRYSLIVFVLSVLVTVLALVLQTYAGRYFSEVSLLGVIVRVLLTTAGISNVALVTYLLGNLKKELDRLSWIIIGVATLGAVMIAWGGSLSLWAALTMVLVAGLLNFIKPDER